MTLYGFFVNDSKTATLTKMTDVGEGNGFLGGRWHCEDLKQGPKAEIVAECSRLNAAIADAMRGQR